MPSLPFTFEDLVNLNPADQMRAAKEADVDPTAANNMKAQNFLVSKLNNLKESMSSSDGLLDVGLAMNPVTRGVDMASKFFGGPGIVQGFKDGVTHETGTRREVRVPPLMF
jgi:hypothetical protein